MGGRDRNRSGLIELWKKYKGEVKESDVLQQVAAERNKSNM